MSDMERLTKRIGDSLVVFTQGKYRDTIPAEMDNDDIRMVLKKLADYEDAEEQGLQREVPLKIGDVAWAIRNYNGVRRAQKGFVREMFYTQDMRLCIAVDRVARGEFGKKIFRTQEEAEAAIEKKGQYNVFRL